MKYACPLDMISRKFTVAWSMFLGLVLGFLALPVAAAALDQPPELEIRTFHVDPNNYLPAMQVRGTVYTLGGDLSGWARESRKTTNVMVFDTDESLKSAVQAATRQYISAMGVDLSANAGKAVIFDGRHGTIIVRATRQDLDLIESKIVTLKFPPPQVVIQAKFVQITRPAGGDSTQFWNAGLSNIMSNITNEAATNEQYGYVIGPSLPGSNSIVSASAGTSVLTATLSVALTDPQFHDVLKALEHRDGVEILTMPDITTESGRQAQMKSVDMQSVVVATNVTATNYSLGTKEVALGPVLDVVPTVLGDEYTIQLKLMPRILEFLGYDDPGQFKLQRTDTNGTTVTSVLPLPHFRVRQASTTVTLWDGQTVVIGGFAPVESAMKTKDKVPLLGDLPLVGQLFRNEHSQKVNKYLLIFVTPTLVNPDGTRYYLDDDMPLVKYSVPAQGGTNSVPRR